MRASCFFFDSNNKLKFSRFYDAQKECFTDLPEGFLKDLNNSVLEVWPDVAAGAAKLGSGYYFLAQSDITDSKMKESAIGKLIVGSMIDENVMRDIENSTGCKVSLIKTVTGDKDTYVQDRVRVSLDTDSITKKSDYLFFDVQVKGVNNNSAVILSMSMARNLYNSGVQQFQRFLIISVLVMLFIFIIAIFLLRFFIIKPITSLAAEVKGIVSGKTDGNRLKEYGSHEFKFLRNSINTMLDSIETEQAKVKSHEEKLYATLHSVGDGVIAVDRQKRVEFLNPVAEKLTGWKLDEAVGQLMEDVFDIINEYSGETTENPAIQVFEQERIVELANHTLLVSKDGVKTPIEDTAAPIRDKNGKVVGCVLVFRNCGERLEKQRRIEYLSYHDQLTGLYNRRFFDEELKRLDKKRNLPISLIYADVNGLKTINDAFGHQYGDKLVKTAAGIFMAECRGDDIIARIGGDEFVMILPKTDLETAERVAIRVKNKINMKKIVDISISTSFGWDTKVEESQPIREVLKNAENLMYKKKLLEKSSKKNTVIRSILNTLKVKAPKEGAHSNRVGILCGQMGKAFGLNDDEITELKTAGELHDIGKIAVDEAILNKSAKLSQSEWAHIKSHPEIGYRLLSNSHEFYNLAEYVLAHHERWDGKGYPKGIEGNAINWKSRIIAVADAYDAMTSERPYRGALTEEEAVNELMKNAGKQFDPEIVQVFIKKVLGTDNALNR